MTKPRTIAFSPEDWLRDEALSKCPPAARGVWMDAICWMYKHETDHVAGTLDELARLCRCNAAEMAAAVDTLRGSVTVVYSECNGHVTLASRRRQRELKRRELIRLRVSDYRRKAKCNPPGNQDAAKTGNAPATPTGNAPVTPADQGEPERPPHAPSLKAVQGWAAVIGASLQEAERFYHHFEASGWVDKYQRPIRNARSRFITWCADNRARPLEAAHHASETAPGKPASAPPPTPGNLSTSDKILFQEELRRVEERLRKIAAAASHDAWGPHYDDKQVIERKKLKVRQQELKTLLGFSA